MKEIIVCTRCNKETDQHTDHICEECWSFATKYLEDTEEL